MVRPSVFATAVVPLEDMKKYSGGKGGTGMLFNMLYWLVTCHSGNLGSSVLPLTLWATWTHACILAAAIKCCCCQKSSSPSCLLTSVMLCCALQRCQQQVVIQKT
jgi:hypothetical protein